MYSNYDTKINFTKFFKKRIIIQNWKKKQKNNNFMYEKMNSI